MALEALRARPFCLWLLDREVCGDRGGIKGHVEHERSRLREIPGQQLEQNGKCQRLPTLIVSGFAREADEEVAACRTERMPSRCA